MARGGRGWNRGRNDDERDEGAAPAPRTLLMFILFRLVSNSPSATRLPTPPPPARPVVASAVGGARHHLTRIWLAVPGRERDRERVEED